jgi:hypothetical protein
MQKPLNLLLVENQGVNGRRRSRRRTTDNPSGSRGRRPAAGRRSEGSPPFWTVKSYLQRIVPSTASAIEVLEFVPLEHIAEAAPPAPFGRFELRFVSHLCRFDIDRGAPPRIENCHAHWRGDRGSLGRGCGRTSEAVAHA